VIEQRAAERRGRIRADVSVMGTVEGPSGEHPMVLLNLSASGAMIQTHEPPAGEATYTLRFSISKHAYELAFQVLYFVQQGDAYGWRGPFSGVSDKQAESIDRAVKAAIGLAESTLRAWKDVVAEAQGQPSAKITVGCTPAGHDIVVAAQDVMDMGAEGLELYARLMCELETI